MTNHLDQAAAEERFRSVFAHLGSVSAYARRRGNADADAVAAASRNRASAVATTGARLVRGEGRARVCASSFLRTLPNVSPRSAWALRRMVSEEAVRRVQRTRRRIAATWPDSLHKTLA